jgi:hypothetical protein
MVLLVALAWAPLTSHCRIEAVPGFEFLRCSTDSPPSNEGGDPCDDGGCCSIESAKYQPIRQQDVTSVVLVAILPSDGIGRVEQRLPAGACPWISSVAPAHLSSTWQFSRRAALPVRAPSSVS